MNSKGGENKLKRKMTEKNLKISKDNEANRKMKNE